MGKKAAIKIIEGTDNVFADLGLPDAGGLRIKAELTRQIYHRIAKLGLTQTQAAVRLGLKQPDVSNLMRGRFTGFSLDRLIALLTHLDTDVEIVLHARTRKKGRATQGIVRIMGGAPRIN